MSDASTLEYQEKTFLKICEQIKEIGKIFGYNPHDAEGWAVEQFSTLFTALRSLLPFKEGDRVELASNPVLKGTWSDLGHFLRKGEEGTVHSIELYQGKLTANVVMDNESWIDSKGKTQPVTSKHIYYFPLDILRKIP